ncbi:MAG TPA: LLM class flavin-dependent oxidoreductase [Roseiflexaceae bacterium]|nr:LLM class flavin-dependent oxidoreductase [Roseiflexaceae bacterium]
MTQSTVSIAFQTDQPLAAYSVLAQASEDYGFDGVTVYNDMLYQPAWLPLLEIARHSRRVRIGPAAVNPFTCHPINIAGNIALLDEASSGRAYLGLTRGAWLDFVGLDPPRPVAALREALECVRHLLSQSTQPYHGKVFQLAGGDALRWKILRPDIPLLLGAWGARTIRACIQHIGEIKIGGTTNPAIVRQVRAEVDQAALAAGRDLAEIGLVVGAVTVVDRDGSAARALARRKAALYLPIIAQLDHTLALDPQLLERINAAAAAYDFELAGSYISDTLLRRLAFAGTPAEVAEHASELYAAGAARIEFGTPHGLTEEQGLRLLGTEVLPALRSSGVLG